MTRNLAAAVGVGLALPILGWAGYAANTPQAPEVLLPLRIVYSLVTSLLGLLGFAIALAYPLERTRKAASREGICPRRAGALVAAPFPSRWILEATS